MENNVVLTMRGITMTFPGVKALDHVDFTLRKGEIHAPVSYTHLDVYKRQLEEVRDVASLVDSMLEDYISAEISLSAQSNRRMTRVVILSAVLEVLILLGALLLSARMGLALIHI